MEKIPKHLGIENIEELYNKLYNQKEPFDLLLPNSITSFDFGITTLLIQFINSWIRINPGKLLVETKEDYSDLEDTIKNDYVFPAVIMAWDRGIFDQRMNSIKSLVRPINEKIVDSMQSLENLPLFDKKFIPQKGLKSLLTCFDHLPPEKGFLDCFYINNTFIPTKKYLSDSLEETLYYILSFNEKGRKSMKLVKNDLIEIIYELMKNTHDWARSDNSYKPLNPNTRGVLLKFVKKTKDNYILNYKNHNGLKDYFESFNTNDKNELYFIEISVFDSGIGMVNRFVSKDVELEINEQVKIIKDCLIKHNTSDRSIERENKGIGLDEMMRTLDKKGLFIIRTSNAFIFRNMKKDPYVATTDTQDIQLFDWKTSEEDNYTKFEKCIGSNVTIVYPIILD